MKAGRELDALVAEKIFGIRITDTFTGKSTPTSATAIMHMSENQRRLVPNYSTDIAAAWEVLERLKERGQMAQIHFTDGRWAAAWRQYNDPPSKMIMMTAQTAPHAICLAALKSVNG